MIDVKEKADPFYDRHNIAVNQFPSLPPEIAKYSQSTSAINSLSTKDELIKVNSSKHDKEHETLLDYAQRNKVSNVVEDKSKPGKEIGIEIFGSKEVVRLKGTKEIVTNGAIDKRRKKHKQITANMLESLPSDKIDEIILESSGVNLIMSNLDKIPLSLVSNVDKSQQNNTSLKEIITEYIDDEKHKQRDDKLSMAPEGRHSLSAIAEIASLEKENSKALSNSSKENVRIVNIDPQKVDQLFNGKSYDINSLPNRVKSKEHNQIG